MSGGHITLQEYQGGSIGLGTVLCVAVGQGVSSRLGALDFAAFSDMAASGSLRRRLQQRFARRDLAAPFVDESSRREIAACLACLPAASQQLLAVVYDLQQLGQFEHSACRVLVACFCDGAGVDEFA